MFVMDASSFTAPEAGRLVRTAQGGAAFVPSPLPPPLQPNWKLLDRLALAERVVGTLNGIGRTLPNPHLLVHPLLHREAVLSSRIEGTEASLDDLVLFEAA